MPNSGGADSAGSLAQPQFVGAPPTASESGDITVTQAVDGASMTISGLNSDSDGDYELVGEIYQSAAGAIVLKPGNVTANQSSIDLSGSAVASLQITNTGAARKVTFKVFLTSKKGVTRIFTSLTANRDPATNIISGGSAINGIWSDTTTTFALITLAQSSGNIKAGSWVRLTKLGRVY